MKDGLWLKNDGKKSRGFHIPSAPIRSYPPACYLDVIFEHCRGQKAPTACLDPFLILIAKALRASVAPLSDFS